MESSTSQLVSRIICHLQFDHPRPIRVFALSDNDDKSSYGVSIKVSEVLIYIYRMVK